MEFLDGLRKIAERGTLSDASADHVLEIAYLAIAADRKLTDDEIAAFRVVIGSLKGKEATQAKLDTTLNRFNVDRDREETDARLRQLALELDTTGRELAYKVARALALADMDASDEEFEFDLQLIEALELKNDRAEDLADEVFAVVTPPEE